MQHKSCLNHLSPSYIKQEATFSQEMVGMDESGCRILTPEPTLKLCSALRKDCRFGLMLINRSDNNQIFWRKTNEICLLKCQISTFLLLVRFNIFTLCYWRSDIFTISCRDKAKLPLLHKWNREKWFLHSDISFCFSAAGILMKYKWLKVSYLIQCFLAQCGSKE